MTLNRSLSCQGNCWYKSLGRTVRATFYLVQWYINRYLVYVGPTMKTERSLWYDRAYVIVHQATAGTVALQVLVPGLFIGTMVIVSDNFFQDCLKGLA